MANNERTVSLVLGSGGARGLAHIGVIRWLEENGYEVRAVSGSSMGALVGGIHAIGKLDDYEQWMCSISRSDMLELLDISLGADGLIKGDKLIDTLKDLLGDARIEDLDISFTAVATNIGRSREVWFQEGSLFDAIKASISLPMFFKPFQFNGEGLVDGGILNPLPMAPVFRDHSRYLVAVNLCGPHDKDMPLDVDEEEVAGSDSESLMSRVVFGVADAVKTTMKQKTVDISAYEVLSRSVDAMQGAIARQQLAVYPPDSLVEIPFNLCGMMDFHKAKAIIEYGYEQADAILSKELNGSRKND